MEQTATTLEDLLAHVRDLATAREFGATVISLVPKSLKFRLAREACDVLARGWTDQTLRFWLSPSNHAGKSLAKARARNRETSKAWRSDNREAVAAYWRERRREDPLFNLQNRLRVRMSHAVSGRRKCASTMELVGCSAEALKVHIERQFARGMSWDNYGDWHVDHVRPCASFDLTDPEQQRACFHFSNLAPLWAEANIGKGSSYGGERHRHRRS